MSESDKSFPEVGDNGESSGGISAQSKSRYYLAHPGVSPGYPGLGDDAGLEPSQAGARRGYSA